MKVTQHQFEEAIRKTGGLYSASVNYIKKKWGVDITRQAVKDRAEKSPELLNEVREAAKDKAESVVFDCMSDKNSTVKFKAATYYLDRLGADRGYEVKSTVDHTTKGEKINKEVHVTSEEAKQIWKDLNENL